MQTDLEAPATEPRDVQEGVRLDGVRKAFGPVLALDGVDLAVAAGEVVAVVGPSGCGKSTLLELVCRLAAPDAGAVSAPPAVLMPQRDGLLPWLSALDNAALARRVAGDSRTIARARAHAHFAAVGLEGFEGARASGVAGGGAWGRGGRGGGGGGGRGWCAPRPLGGPPPPFLCLDEPFAALD